MCGWFVGKAVTEVQKNQTVWFDVDADSSVSKITKKHGINKCILDSKKTKMKFTFDVDENTELI